MNKLIFLLLVSIIFFSCNRGENKIDGIYSTEGGPFFKFYDNKFFEFGIPGDKNPLKGTYTFENKSLSLLANAIILGSYSTTNFLCNINNDTLTIDVLHITHPRFEVFINKPKNYAKTVRDTITTEFKLNTPEAEEELFIYYKLVFDKFIKRKRG